MPFPRAGPRRERYDSAPPLVPEEAALGKYLLAEDFEHRRQLERQQRSALQELSSSNTVISGERFPPTRATVREATVREREGFPRGVQGVASANRRPPPAQPVLPK